jgi:hypothetical protein
VIPDQEVSGSNPVGRISWKAGFNGFAGIRFFVILNSIPTLQKIKA